MISIAATRLLSLVIISSPVCYQYKDVHLCFAIYVHLLLLLCKGFFLCKKHIYNSTMFVCIFGVKLTSTDLMAVVMS